MLSVTRAWRLVKFVDNGMLTMTRCSCCGGHFVTHPHEIARHYVCGLCNPPARAGKGKAAGSLRLGAVGAADEALLQPELVEGSQAGLDGGLQADEEPAFDPQAEAEAEAYLLAARGRAPFRGALVA
jgi:hypothetical protein